jgi:transcriptional regulator with XRE-family HTH domain
MVSKEELLKHPNYLLTTYQLEIYKHLVQYKKEHKLTQTEIAEKLNVSSSYISQIMNGEFNFTLKKLIELGLFIGKIPFLEFLSPEEYWAKVDGLSNTPTLSITVNIFSSELLLKKNKEQQVNPNIQQVKGAIAYAQVMAGDPSDASSFN